MGLIGIIGAVPLVIGIVLIVIVFKMRGSLFKFATGDSKEGCDTDKAKKRVLILGVVLLVVAYSLWPASAFVPIFRPDAEASGIAFVGCLVFWLICIAISMQVPCLLSKEEEDAETL